MNDQEKAHQILVRARHIFELTGWCKNSMEDEDGNGCMLSSVSVALGLEQSEWPSIWLGSLEDKKVAVELALCNLAVSADEVHQALNLPFPMNFKPGQSIDRAEITIYGLNDVVGSTREDCLLAFDKAIANT